MHDKRSPPDLLIFILVSSIEYLPHLVRVKSQQFRYNFQRDQIGDVLGLSFADNALNQPQVFDDMQRPEGAEESGSEFPHFPESVGE